MMLRTVTLVALAATAVLAQGGFTGPGRYTITNLKSGRTMGAGGGGTVVQFAGEGAESQVWEFESAGSGYYYIRNVASGEYLDASISRNSTPLRTSRRGGGPSQQWRIEPGKDGNALIIARTGKAIDVPDGSSRDGLHWQVYDLNGDSNQRFLLRPLGRGMGVRQMPTPIPERRMAAEPSPVPGPRGRLTCSSDDGRRHYCAADTRGGVRLVRQISGSPCREGYSWGHDGNGIWVDRGCRAEFEAGGGFGPGDQRRMPPRAVTLRCASEGRRTFCEADTSRGVRLVRQFGGPPCRLNESWGYDRRGIWVDRGCRAEFELGAGR